MIGQLINERYRVEEKIGRGGFGQVYRCVDHMNRNVALKILRPERHDEKMLRRFEDEGKKLAAMNHPNVVQVFDFGFWDERPYIVMEYLNGPTVDRMLADGTVNTRQALEVMTNVASGLEAIHAAGLVHRDLKPNNIIVPSMGLPKILDLGLAKGLTAEFALSSESVLVGTPPYMSPEQLEGRNLSYSSDIFSFGIVLYEAICGEYPFAGEHPKAVLYAIAHRDPKPLHERFAGCPPALSTIVSSCLEKRPEDRPENIRIVRSALSEILRTIPFDSMSQASTMPVPRPPRATPNNPYLNRVMIKRRGDFFGRAQEVKRIYARLNATPPGSVSVVGESKIGKSSLLNYIYMPQNRQEYLEYPDRMIMVFLDFQQEQSMTMDSFVRTLTGMVNLELKGRLDVSDCSSGLDGIRSLIHRLDDSGYRLAILMDGFESITRNPNFDLEFFSFLRFLANHFNVAYLTSSIRPLQILCHTQEIADSPFFNIFSTMRLGLFELSDAQQLIAIPSERVGNSLEPYTESLLDMAGLFPVFLQMACSHAVEFLEEYPAGQVDLAAVRRRFYDEAIDYYEHIWESLTVEERKTVECLANAKKLPESKEYVVPELRRKSYICEVQGRPMLFSDTFREFSLAKAAEHRTGFFRRFFRGSSG